MMGVNEIAGRHSKTIAAAVGAVLSWAAVVVASDSVAVTASEWLMLATNLAIAGGVYIAPANTKP